MLVVGGGFGGVAAALAAVSRGVNVVITEPTRWLGGVLSSQAVPPDEHVWIEQFGSTASYRDFRERIRAYYRAHYPLTAEANATRALNPGAARVSHLCHEPRVGVAVLESLLAPHRSSGRLRVLLQHDPISASTTGDRVDAVTFRDGTTGQHITITAPWFVDASETGDLLPMAGVEHVTGSESQAQTEEPHAPAKAQPLNMQPVSVCFALDHLPGADLTIDKPSGYADIAAARSLDWPEGQLSFITPHPKTRQPIQHRFEPNPDDNPDDITPDYDDRRAHTIDRNLWTFRRITARNNFVHGSYASDITLVNWPQMDYWGGPLYGVSDEDASEHLQGARNLSLSLLYWLQTEAPRPDGGTGWPGLRLRGDVVGDTPDGLAMAPYIRESRRIAAEHTIVEQDIALDVRGHHGAVQHPDSVGIGLYRIDLHPSTGGDPYIDIGCCPYQLPLGALLPIRVENLLPAAKNIGTTHITNGAYRMPLVEWNIGEVVGHLVAFCTTNDVPPRSVRHTEELFAQFSTELDRVGVERAWPNIQGY
jgi:hypothetical protein